MTNLQDELMDIYDEHRNLLGNQVPRAEAKQLADGQFYLVTTVWVMTPDGKLLITQRSANRETNPGRWECTGGAVDAGETSREAACRELEEEIGLEVEETELIFLHTQVRGNHFVDAWLVKKPVVPEALTLQQDEVADARLITFEQLEQLAESEEMMVPACSSIFHHCHDKFQMLVQALTDAEGDKD